MEMLLAVVAGRAPGAWENHVVAGQDHFPEGMARKTYYRPSQRGFEREIKKSLEYWRRLRADTRRRPDGEDDG